MSPHARLPLRLLPGLFVLTWLIIGCGSKVVVVEFTENEKHMKRLAGIYNAYKAAKRTTPKNTAELKAWVKSLPKTELERMSIDDPEKVFVSPRDGQEYVVMPTPKNAPMGMATIAYEKQGVDGKRWTVSTQSYIGEVTDQELDQLLKQLGHKR
jgi:hypothetical protein